MGDRRIDVGHQGAEVDFYPSDVAQPEARDPGTLEPCRYPEGEVSHGVSKRDPGESPALAAFWQLLRDASYYTW